MEGSPDDLIYMYKRVRDYYYSQYISQLKEYIRPLSIAENIVIEDSNEIVGYRTSLEFTFDGEILFYDVIFDETFRNIIVFDVMSQVYEMHPLLMDGMLNPVVFVDSNAMENLSTLQMQLNQGRFPILDFEDTEDVGVNILEKSLYLGILKEQIIFTNQINEVSGGLGALPFILKLHPSEIDQLIRTFEIIDKIETLQSLDVSLVDVNDDPIDIKLFLDTVSDSLLASNYERLFPENYASVFLDKAIDKSILSDRAIDVNNKNGKMPISLARNILGDEYRYILNDFYDHTVYSELNIFNGYHVSNSHSIYTNSVFTTSSLIHHYFGDISTRDITDGSLIIAVQNMIGAIKNEYFNLPFIMDNNFLDQFRENRNSGNSFFKSIFDSAVQTSITRDASQDIPMNMDLWFDMLLENIQIASWQEAILLDKFTDYFLVPVMDQ